MLRWVTYLSNRVFFTSSSKFYSRRFFACFKHLRYTLHYHSLFLGRHWVFVVVFLVRPRTWYLTRTSPAGFLLSNIIPGLTFSEKDRHHFYVGWMYKGWFLSKRSSQNTAFCIIRRLKKASRWNRKMSRSYPQFPRSTLARTRTMTPFWWPKTARILWLTPSYGSSNN